MWKLWSDFLRRIRITDIESLIESDDYIYAVFNAYVNTNFMFNGVYYMSLCVTSKGNKISMMIGKVKKLIDGMEKANLSVSWKGKKNQVLVQQYARNA